MTRPNVIPLTVLVPLAILMSETGTGARPEATQMFGKYAQKQMLHGDAGIRMPWSVSATRGSGASRSGGATG